MIRLEKVEKVYRRPDGSTVRALAGIDLVVEPGQFVVVRGPSGCGKTTLLNIMGGLARPTAGRVEVAGADLARMGPAQRAAFRARHIGFVFQTFHLLPYLDVLSNVLLAALPGQEGASRQRAEQLLADFHLTDRLHHHPPDLSTGECQRVAIARALLNRPQVLLADEPTGNLDPQNALGVLELLADFHRQGGTVVLVTHQELTSRYAQRTMRLCDGQWELPDSAGTLLAKAPALGY